MPLVLISSPCRSVISMPPPRSMSSVSGCAARPPHRRGAVVFATEPIAFAVRELLPDHRS